MDGQQHADLATRENYRIYGHDSFYIPNFLSAEEEQYILRKIHESPRQKWKQLANRRYGVGRQPLKGFATLIPNRKGGEITAKGLLPQGLPSYLTIYPNIIERLKATGAFSQSPHKEPNHIILNEYQPGQGIMPHEDGPKYFPVVATISLGSHAVFNYYRYKSDLPEAEATEGKIVDKVPVLSVLLEPRSLIISSGGMYTSYLHGIDPLEEDYILPPVRARPSPSDENPDLHVVHQHATSIGNWETLGDAETKRIVANGGILKRGTRYSLTCRDVEHISSARSFRLV